MAVDYHGIWTCVFANIGGGIAFHAWQPGWGGKIQAVEHFTGIYSHLTAVQLLGRSDHMTLWPSSHFGPKPIASHPDSKLGFKCGDHTVNIGATSSIFG